jgi:hypothetical protein
MQRGYGLPGGYAGVFRVEPVRAMPHWQDRGVRRDDAELRHHVERMRGVQRQLR